MICTNSVPAAAVYTQERDVAERRQKELESEMESLKERLEASQRAWSVMRKELADEKSQRAGDVDRERLAAAADLQARSFKDCLSRMLSDSRVSVEPYEEPIRERVEATIVALHDKTAVRTVAAVHLTFRSFATRLSADKTRGPSSGQHSAR